MFSPPSLYSSTDAWNRLPSQSSQTVVTPAIIAEVGVDHPGAVAGRAGALGVGAEERGLHAVGLRERLADRLEQARCTSRGCCAASRGWGSGRRHDAVRPTTEPWISELLPEPATPVTTTSTPSGMSTSTFLQVVRVRAAHLHHARRRAHLGLSGAVAEVRPVSVPLARSPATVPSNTTSRRRCLRRGPRSTTWSAIAIVSGLCSTTSTVLPLSRSRRRRLVHALDVVRVQPDRRLVEDVGHVGERRAEVADHLRALRLAARERARRAGRGER
jgi:hypothetical protein